MNKIIFFLQFIMILTSSSVFAQSEKCDPSCDRLFEHANPAEKIIAFVILAIPVDLEVNSIFADEQERQKSAVDSIEQEFINKVRLKHELDDTIKLPFGVVRLPIDRETLKDLIDNPDVKKIQTHSPFSDTPFPKRR